MGKVVADIGSGTGISARPLLERGCTVIGVEPNEPMRQAAERLLAEFAGFRSVDGTAEATNLADQSVDAILAAQAFHWFDRERAKAEFRRILKPGGVMILVWNERRTDSTPFLREYEAMLIEQGTDYARVRHENVDDAAIAAFFAPAIARKREFDNAQHFDEAGFVARVFSSSYTPSAGDPRYAAMLDAVRKLFAKHAKDGKVSFEYDTRVHYGRW
jgi:ubiquinone/menaquinone biosynthesis C-methylase UbiE